MDNNYNSYSQGPEPGKNFAIASMVLGIVSCVLAWFGYSVIIALVCGILGLIFWSKAKKIGFIGGLLTAGFVLSLIGTILSTLVFVACVACVGLFSCASIAANA